MKKPTKPLPPQVKITDDQDRPSPDFHRWLSQFFAWVESLFDGGPIEPPPALTGSTTPGTATYSTRTGSFQRIKDSVSFSIALTLTAKGTMAGNIRITGLPYPAVTNATVAVAASGVTLSNASSQLIGIIPGGTNRIDLYEQRSGTALAFVTAAMIAATTTVYASGVYTAPPLE